MHPPATLESEDDNSKVELETVPNSPTDITLMTEPIITTVAVTDEGQSESAGINRQRAGEEGAPPASCEAAHAQRIFTAPAEPRRKRPNAVKSCQTRQAWPSAAAPPPRPPHHRSSSQIARDRQAENACAPGLGSAILKMQRDG